MPTFEVFPMTIMQSPNRTTQLAVSALLAASFLALSASNAHAATIIKQPGAHPQYSWEIEPHLVFDFDNKDYLDEGIGPGVHIAIPIMHQGPITTINNNMAIKFGFDFVFHGDCDNGWSNRYTWNDCDAKSFMIPIALQWNFYITDIITAFGEPGIYLRHSWVEWDCAAGNGACDDSETDGWMYLGVGAKFMFGQNAGLTVRLGYPHATVGASILF